MRGRKLILGQLPHPSLLTAAVIYLFCAATSDGCELSESRPDSSLLFSQPDLVGVDGNFHVPIAEGRYPSDHPFNMILWEPNPDTPTGTFVATSWAAGSKTGFYPPGPITAFQAATSDRERATTVQIEGRTVGAFLNSSDYPHGRGGGDKLMITPAFMPAEPIAQSPFDTSESLLETCLKLQVPYATDGNRPGNYAYVVAIFVFQDRISSVKLSYMVTLFHHALGLELAPKQEWLKATEFGGFDLPSRTYMIENPAVQGSRIVTPSRQGAPFQTSPWTGWKVFDFYITRANFQNALDDLGKTIPPFPGARDPASYNLIEWHLNAELTYQTGPAQLGWSMQGAQIYLMRPH